MGRTYDIANPVDAATAALDLALKSNGCMGTYAAGPKEPLQPATLRFALGGKCQRYTGCPADVAERYPLIFCTTTGVAAQSSAESAIVPAFRAFVSPLDPQP